MRNFAKALVGSRALLIGMALLTLGAGLQATLLGVRATLEGLSTFATGLVLASYYVGFIVGSIANIIVVDAARRRGIALDWRTHARTGVPVTLVTLAITAVWFALRH